MSDDRRKERGPNKILAIAEHVDVNLPDYSSKFKRGALMIQLYFDFDNLIDKCHVTCNYKQSLKSFSLYFSDMEVF